MANSYYKLANSPFAPDRLPKKQALSGLELLVAGRYLNMQSSGVYNLYPLGVKVLENIRSVIREELDKCGVFEVDFASLQVPDPWELTGRFDDEVVDVWLKSTSKSGTEYGLAFTHEEPITNAMSSILNSYRQFPFSVTQFQTKFRDELRPRAGLIRLREFEMNDSYTFSTSPEMHKEIYELYAQAYERIFERLGLGQQTKRVLASGGAFSKYSEEFQTLSEIGEDTIYVNRETGVAVNAEILADYIAQNGGSVADFDEFRSVEVGNIFSLGTRFSEPLGCTFTDQDGNQFPLIMGSYGIGTHRVLGMIAELYATSRGIAWPDEVAPIDVHISVLFPTIQSVQFAKDLAEKLVAEGKSVSIEDSVNGVGPKLGIADQIGSPTHVLINGKSLNASLESGEEFELEVHSRSSGSKAMLNVNAFLDSLTPKTGLTLS